MAAAAGAIAEMTGKVAENFDNKASKAILGLSLDDLKKAGRLVADSLLKVPGIINNIAKIAEKFCTGRPGCYQHRGASGGDWHER